jgi:hypothetical protein
MDRRRRSLIRLQVGTWRNSFADKDQKGRDLQKFDRVEELICDLGHMHSSSFKNSGGQFLKIVKISISYHIIFISSVIS